MFFFFFVFYIHKISIDIKVSSTKENNNNNKTRRLCKFFVRRYSTKRIGRVLVFANLMFLNSKTYSSATAEVLFSKFTLNRRQDSH